MKVIFMGTPDFAVPSLKALIESQDIEVTAVFSQRPKPKGRGYAAAKSPVQQLAEQHDIAVYTPKTLRKPAIQEQINQMPADIIIVVAYGFIVPPEVLNSKPKGCLNIHPSKLPRFRGAAPLQYTILHGDKETEICIMQMDEGLDTGDVLLKANLALDARVTLPELHDKCADIGAKLLLQTLRNYDDLTPQKQSEEGLVYAHKLEKHHGKIDWQQSAFAIDCQVRAMNPWPGVYFEYEGEKIKILAANYDSKPHNFAPGEVVDGGLAITCAIGKLYIEKLQRSGKKPLAIRDFLRGFKIKGSVE